MAAHDDAARATGHDDLIEIARESIGAQYGLTSAQARRLAGSTADELRHDARAMAAELGIKVDDEQSDRGRQRDGSGRFASGASMNERIRAASGR